MEPTGSRQGHQGLEGIVVEPGFKNAVLALDGITDIATQLIDPQIIGEWLRLNKVVTKVPEEVSSSYRAMRKKGAKQGRIPSAPLPYEKVIAAGNTCVLIGRRVEIEGIELSAEDAAAINVAKNLADWDERRGCYIVTDKPGLIEAARQVSDRYGVTLEVLTRQFAQKSLPYLIRSITQKDRGIELLVPAGVVAELYELGRGRGRERERSGREGGFRLNWSTRNYTYGDETVEIGVVSGLTESRLTEKSDSPGNYKTMRVVWTATSDAWQVRPSLARIYQHAIKSEELMFAVLSLDRQFLPMFVGLGVKRLNNKPAWWQHRWARV